MLEGSRLFVSKSLAWEWLGLHLNPEEWVGILVVLGRALCSLGSDLKDVLRLPPPPATPPLPIWSAFRAQQAQSTAAASWRGERPRRDSGLFDFSFPPAQEGPTSLPVISGRRESQTLR